MLRLVLILLIPVVPLCGVLPGCSNPDNPTPVAAAPAPAPKPEEVKVPKTSSGTGRYGASSKYQKAMEKLNKVGGKE